MAAFLRRPQVDRGRRNFYLIIILAWAASPYLPKPELKPWTETDRRADPRQAELSALSPKFEGHHAND